MAIPSTSFCLLSSEIAAEMASSGILPYIYDPESEEETEAPEEPRVTIYAGACGPYGQVGRSPACKMLPKK